jgi:hypothetical protein
MGQKTKRYVLASAGLAGMFLMGSLLRSPGSQAKGAYSTPVTVMNTTSSAAGIRDEDSPGRNAFQTSMNLSFTGTSGSGISIPSGKRLVIDYVSAAGSGPPSGTQPYITIFTTVGGGPSISYTLTLTQSPIAIQQFQHSEKVAIYGDTAFVSLAFAGTTPGFLNANVSISGHLIDIP